MNAWMQSNNERRRNACFERVAKVRGRKMRIWSTVESLRLLRNGRATDSTTYLAVPESALHIIHGLIILKAKGDERMKIQN